MEFTEKILKIMEQKGISAYEICKNLKISNTTFSSWKKGSKPSIDKAIEILRYLELSADEIFELKTTEITAEDKQLLEAYNQADIGTRNSVRKLLDMPAEPGKSLTSRTG